MSWLTFYLPISDFKICLNISAFLFFVLFLFSLKKKKCLFPTNVKIHLSDKVYSTYTLSPVPLQHFSEVNRILEVVPVVGAVVPPRPPDSHFKIKAFSPAGRVGGSGLSWVLWDFPTAEESLFAQALCPLPERCYIQWPVNVVQSPCFKAGQLWRAIPAPKPLVGLAEASVAAAAVQSLPGLFSPLALLTRAVSGDTPSWISLIQIWATATVSWGTQPRTMAFPQDLNYRAIIICYVNEKREL